ncbi:hypothetical protein BANT918_02417 [Brevibacterium antiquum CNRZ 918]|uniref:Uncharacterized protein n=1 Tax=Brevibacterium antiquum CNRZ 918 TaxID=1255637 RepID=A0A2H1KHT1_9MICO|nr:hypothetical protein BANT918_02417 [Brevibacterium antiquum CNRZ 918]
MADGKDWILCALKIHQRISWAVLCRVVRPQASLVSSEHQARGRTDYNLSAFLLGGEQCPVLFDT